MLRAACFVLLFLFCSICGHAQASRLARLKRGAHIEVRSIASNQFADVDERCRFVSMDANTLVCNADDDRKVRLVFPIAKVDSVYRIHAKVNVGAILGAAVVGTFIGGLAAVCGPAIAVGGIGSLITLFVMLNQQQDHLWRRMWGIPDPPPEPAERLTLVYQR